MCGLSVRVFTGSVGDNNNNCILFAFICMFALSMNETAVRGLLNAHLFVYFNSVFKCSVWPLSLPLFSNANTFGAANGRSVVAFRSLLCPLIRRHSLFCSSQSRFHDNFIDFSSSLAQLSLSFRPSPPHYFQHPGQNFQIFTGTFLAYFADSSLTFTFRRLHCACSVFYH